MRPIRHARLLGQRLDQLVSSFDVSSLSPDPLELVLRYPDARDQEVVALIAAAFAYGRASIVVKNVGAVLESMEGDPFDYVTRRFDEEEARRRFASFAHRFHKSEHLIALIGKIHATLDRYGSLGALFQEGYAESDRDIARPLTHFVETMIASTPTDPAIEPGLRYLLSSPADGSACKRMNLLLRWMVRRERPDLGLWTFVSPSQLVIPVDTHVHRIATFLGLSSRRSADWITARAITDKLAKFNPADPVRYDFAICRLGVLDLCSRRRRKENCDVCLLRDVCRFPVLN